MVCWWNEREHPMEVLLRYTSRTCLELFGARTLHRVGTSKIEWRAWFHQLYAVEFPSILRLPIFMCCAGLFRLCEAVYGTVLVSIRLVLWRVLHVIACENPILPCLFIVVGFAIRRSFFNKMCHRTDDLPVLSELFRDSHFKRHRIFHNVVLLRLIDEKIYDRRMDFHEVRVWLLRAQGSWPRETKLFAFGRMAQGSRRAFHARSCCVFESSALPYPSRCIAQGVDTWC